MSRLRRLDHVAVAVRDTGVALAYFRDRLGLAVVSSEELERPHVRLTYLDLGNTLLQLVEPLDDSVAVADHLARNGEGLHHLCFGVEDVLGAAAELAAPDAPLPVAGSGRGRLSAFVPGPSPHGVLLECTEFRAAEDAISSLPAT